MLLQFNRAFFPVNLFVSLFLIALLLKYPPDIIRITQSVFLKLGLYVFIIGYQWYSANKSWYYYRNAGFSIRRLFAWSCAIDLLIFLATYTLFYFISKI
jgi:uncharacterized membrane protein